jgi:nucleoside-diphosphate-sugar epimerase
MKKILLTGSFGNVGVSTLMALAGRGHMVRCFDLPTPANREAAKMFGPSVDIHWGDICKPADVARAVDGMDVVLHIAAIIPPLSESKPEMARAVNVGGTKNLIEAMENAGAEGRPLRLVFCSSISVLGRNRDRSRLARPDEPVAPSDHYSQHKVECESLIRNSTLEWSILRLNAVPPISIGQFDPIMFEISLDGQVEFVHTADVGLALANAAESDKIWRKILLIAGGRKCQYHYREFFAGVLGTVGIGMLPESAFGSNNFYTDWMDTTESEALLQYQRHTFDDYLREIDALLSWRKPLIRMFRPVIRRVLLGKSPYYGKQAGKLA